MTQKPDEPAATIPGSLLLRDVLRRATADFQREVARLLALAREDANLGPDYQYDLDQHHWTYVGPP